MLVKVIDVLAGRQKTTAEALESLVAEAAGSLIDRQAALTDALRLRCDGLEVQMFELREQLSLTRIELTLAERRVAELEAELDRLEGGGGGR